MLLDVIGHFSDFNWFTINFPQISFVDEVLVEVVGSGGDGTWQMHLPRIRLGSVGAE